jgi:cytochrome c551/c552
MKKFLKWAAVALVVLFVVAQAIRPAMTNPPVDASKTLRANAQITPEAEAVLERSCRDCHSNETVWPWYSQVAPVSWLLTRDVNEGRHDLNFSEWGTYSQRKVANRLKGICDQVQRGDMPLWFYLPLHPSAKLTDADKKTLCDWSKQELARVSASQPPAQQ